MGAAGAAAKEARATPASGPGASRAGEGAGSTSPGAAAGLEGSAGTEVPMAVSVSAGPDMDRAGSAVMAGTQSGRTAEPLRKKWYETVPSKRTMARADQRPKR